MKFEYAKAPRWTDPEHTMIDLMIKWEQFSHEFPFTASPRDIEAHGRAIFEAAANGQFGDVKEFVAPPILAKDSQ